MFLIKRIESTKQSIHEPEWFELLMEVWSESKKSQSMPMIPAILPHDALK